MNLAAGRYVDSDVTENFCLATQAVAGIQPASLQAILLGLTHFGEMVRAGNDVFLGKTAFDSLHLASSAAGTATADRVNVDTQFPRSLQYRRSKRKAPSLSGRAEDNQGL